MEKAYKDILERLGKALEFIKLSSAFLDSKPANAGVRELYHNTREWVHFNYDTLEKFEKLIGAGLKNADVAVHRTQLCSLTQVLLIVMGEYEKAFDVERLPRGTEDLQ